MAITVVGVGDQSANSTLNATPGAQFPVGYTPTADDFAVVVLAGRPTDTSIPTPEAGWTQRATALREVGANDLRLVAYYRKLTGGDGVPNFTVTTPYSGNSAGMSMFMIVFRGVDTTTPWDVADVTGTNVAADQITPTGITPVTNGAWVLSVVATADDNALALLAGSEQGFTLRAGGANYDTTVGGDHAVGLATKEQATAGAVTCPTWDQTLVGTDAWAWLTLALRPAVGTVFNENPTGAVTPAGALVKTTTKVLGGGITPAGAAVKTTTKAPSGAITPAGALVKSATKVLVGAVTPAGEALKTTTKLLGGVVDFAGALATAKSFVRTLDGAVGFSGGLVKTTTKALSGAVTPSGAVVRLATKVLSGALSPAGALIRATTKLLSGDVTPAGGTTAEKLGGPPEPPPPEGRVTWATKSFDGSDIT